MDKPTVPWPARCACGAGMFVKGRRPMIAILTVMILLCLSDPIATLLER